MYGLESVIINTKTKNSLENAYSQAFTKIFKTFDKNIISICQFNMGYLPIELQLVLKQLKFWIGVKRSGNATFNFLATLHNDWKTLINKYWENKKFGDKSLKNAVWGLFADKISEFDVWALSIDKLAYNRLIVCQYDISLNFRFHSKFNFSVVMTIV